MILFPLFCLFFFTRISAENLCLTWLFLSTEASPVVGRAPSHWAELGVWCPLFIPKLLHVEAPPKAGECSEMPDSHSHRAVRKMHTRGNSHLIITRTVWFCRVCFVPVWFEVVCTKPRELNSSWTAPCSAKHSPVVCAVGPLWDKQETKWNENEERQEGGRLKTKENKINELYCHQR